MADAKNILVTAAAGLMVCAAVPLTVYSAWEIIPEIPKTAVQGEILDSNNKVYKLSDSFHVGANALDIDIEAAAEEKQTHLPEGSEIPVPKPSEEVLDAVPYPTAA